MHLLTNLLVESIFDLFVFSNIIFIIFGICKVLTSKKTKFFAKIIVLLYNLLLILFELISIVLIKDLNSSFFLVKISFIMFS